MNKAPLVRHFIELQNKIDNLIVNLCPELESYFVSIFQSLDSSKPIEWTNAIHMCRRILEVLANTVLPPSTEILFKDNKQINLGENKYINRLVHFVEQNSSSSASAQIITGYIKDYYLPRVKALFNATQKGSHIVIDDKSEAELYIILTYLFVGEILSLFAAEFFEDVLILGVSNSVCVKQISEKPIILNFDFEQAIRPYQLQIKMDYPMGSHTNLNIHFIQDSEMHSSIDLGARITFSDDINSGLEEGFFLQAATYRFSLNEPLLLLALGDCLTQLKINIFKYHPTCS